MDTTCIVNHPNVLPMVLSCMFMKCWIIQEEMISAQLKMILPQFADDGGQWAVSKNIDLAAEYRRGTMTNWQGGGVPNGE